MFKLRDYQEQAITATYKFWKEKKGNNPLIVMGTGSGKTIVIASIVTDFVASGLRVLVVTHAKELIEQNHSTFKKICPDSDTGIFSASLKSKQLHNNIIFAGVQSIWNKVHKTSKFDLIIIDEAHMIPSASTTRYVKMLDMLKIINPNVKILGLTATPYRLGTGMLYGEKDSLFDGVSYEVKMSVLLDGGYILPPISKNGIKTINMTGIKKRGGEYIESEVAKAASTPELVSCVVSEVISSGADRTAWLVFASGIEHAELLRAEFMQNNIQCEVLTGTTPRKEREHIVAEFKNGHIKCLINVGTLTVGFDAPICDLIALVRATMSPGLFSQILGRGCRTYKEKRNFLFLDYGHNIEEHGVFDDIRPPKKAGTRKTEVDGLPRVKACKQCDVVIKVFSKECPECGFLFPEKELDHAREAYTGAMLSSQFVPINVKVDDIIYTRHTKIGSNDSLRVTYFSGMFTSYSEWISVEHETSNVAKWSRAKIYKLGGKGQTVTECLAECHKYLKPTSMDVIKKGKYDKILRLYYDDC